MPRESPERPPLPALLARAYADHGLAARSVLLAVSGGADSTALLAGTARVRDSLRLRVEVATFDHGLRAEAAEEVAAVARLSARLGLACHVRKLALSPGPGVEARAREARYATLEVLRKERDLDAVATGHTMNDQAETLLMRLARGTALRGARGIHAEAATLIRPLLACSRADVLAFLRAEGLDFVRDPMNADPALFRTRVRTGALPALDEAAGFSTVEHLANFARLAAEDEALLARLADASWERLSLPGGGLDAVGLRALEPPLQRRVLARLLGMAGLRVDHATLERGLDAVRRGASTALSGGARLKATGGRVRCVGRHPEAPPGALMLGGPGAAGDFGAWHFQVAEGSSPPGVLGIALGKETAWPLTVRSREPGDRIRTHSGHRKVQDVLVDARVPSEARDAQPVLVDARGGLLWLPGVLAPPAALGEDVHEVASRQSLWATPPGPSERKTPPL
ncbi:tRNA lysidine(34) synthetase TilS [Corallococcus llansteffanensis]|uniref:tRNA(Ile)-lysidine synthase n=1 Tax=Corallococcus llansteffanensis TaxID=2316731 RepID=A0A3A8PJW5_9BACT|nr:tRNA lysidine(34) synthetase TilS [Corallococcus llansteffanensis]RKH56666.1 tRNA lysidine(34) synthetase TilS [Corallococcus llansteffanensis]